MIFSYREDGYETSDKDKELIEKKLVKLEKFDNRLNQADEDAVKIHVNLFRGKKHNSPNFGLRVQLTFTGNSLRAEASGETIANAVDEVERKLRMQIEKLKS
ncbi:HPF/RaiA family ribosome-associated protein [Patescibacteria group bacterium]|nr:HPF/RaiA family ribosome-associated protein [Patescibacteria group bacterium]